MISRLQAVSMIMFPALSFAGTLAAQQASPRIQVSLGFGVDTGKTRAWGDFSWRDPVAEIVRNWCSYLTAVGDARPGQRDAAAFWSAAERRQWPDYDLSGASGYLFGSATILDVRPLRAGDTSEYIVETLFARADSSKGAIAPRIRPIAMTRVIATKENGQWVFANMLPRLTKDWKREQVGPITYVIEPGFSFSRNRAQAAVSFSDSLAKAFSVPTLSQVTYYLTATPDAMNRIVGLSWAITYGGHGGGSSRYRNRLIFSADPVVGEEYRHELAHFILAPLSPPEGSSPFVVEGVATWLGGTLGMTPKETFHAFADFLRRNPVITLDSAMTSSNIDQGFRPGGAVLSAMIFARGGTSAIADLLRTPRRDPIEPVVQRLLNASWDEISRLWRATAMQERVGREKQHQ